MDEFENSMIRGIHISRYIASWLKVDGIISNRANRGQKRTNLFVNWLRSLTIDGEKLTEDEVWRIYDFAMNGELELETSAKRYLDLLWY